MPIDPPPATTLEQDQDRFRRWGASPPPFPTWSEFFSTVRAVETLEAERQAKWGPPPDGLPTWEDWTVQNPSLLISDFGDARAVSEPVMTPPAARDIHAARTVSESEAIRAGMPWPGRAGLGPRRYSIRIELATHSATTDLVLHRLGRVLDAVEGSGLTFQTLSID